MSQGCAPRRSRLAEGPFASVDTCSCGTLHLTVGALTLRLEPEVAESIWNTLGQALQHLSEPAADEVPKPMDIFLRGVRGGGRPS